MKKMVIFEPAMCCSTGVCGPSVNFDLMRISTVLNNLTEKGIQVERYNLSDNPQSFIDNKKVNEIIKKDGVDFLPVTFVDGEIVKTKEYPSNEEIVKWLDVPEKYIENTESKGSEGCCADKNTCDIGCGPKKETSQSDSGCGSGCC